MESSIYDEKDEEIYNTVKVVKTDEDKEPLRGVKFGLYTDKGKFVDSGYTDKNGELLFSDLSDGSYYVQEEKQLPGYILDNTEYDLTVKGGEEKVIKVVNEKEEGDGWLSVKKYVTGTTHLCLMYSSELLLRTATIEPSQRILPVVFISQFR